jgi:Tfp pilus assembly protein PilF
MLNNRQFRLASAVLLLLALSACSLPKIIVLKDPLTAEEHVNLGAIYEQQGKDLLALQQYQEALEKDSHFVSALLRTGDLSFKLHRFEEAEKMYRKAIDLQPENGDIYNNLCWVAIQTNKKPEDALNLIDTAIRLTPAHRAYYLDTRGVVLLRLGKAPDAVATLQQAVALLANDKPDLLSEAYRHLSDAFRAAGEFAQADEALAASHRALITRSSNTAVPEQVK